MVSDPQADSWRDARGRFGPGNPGGPGGPRRRADYLRAMENAVTLEHITGVTRKAALKALGGDNKAIEIVLNRFCGRPAEAPEAAEELDFTIQDLNTVDACREATETVIQKVTQGKVNRTTGELLLNGIRSCLTALEARQRGQEGEPVPDPKPPVPNNVLKAYFQRFRRSGELPEDEHEAIVVVAKVKAGFELVACPGLLPETTTHEFVPRPRAEDPAMDAVLDEAAAGTGLVRVCARFLLQNFARLGRDVTAPQLQDWLPPEFGSMAMEFTGFLERLVRKPYAKQARRLLNRLPALREQVPKTPKAHRAWHQKLDQATVVFQLSGEQPESDDMMNTILAMGEMTALVRHFVGEDVRQEMELFEKIAQATGAARKVAIDELAALARSGHFDGAKPVAAVTPPRRPCASPRRRGACRPAR